MRSNLSAVVWRLMIFAAVCLLGLFVLVAVFAQLRFGPKHEYVAEFTNIGGLKNGDIVRIAGVEVGKVADIAIRSDASVAVDFNVDDTVQLTETSRAVIRFDNLYGDRYLTLEAGDGGGKPLPPGSTIPISRTAPALDLDTLIGGFRPLFRALDPEQVNALSSQLIQAFQGQGDAIGSVLTQSAALTNTLADRDELIGQLITNLNTVLGTLGDSNEEFGQAITEIALTTEVLAERRVDISNSIAYADNAASNVADLLARSRPALQKITNETDRVGTIVLNEHDYFDDLLNTLPDAYKMLGRQGLYGDWFAFYICEAIIKVNGKGGQPVYIKAAGQTSGRCTPK
ncbi:putative phospholipid ABC transporter-binding protein MlaD [Mycolicibacterium vanbaalenii]|uniref:Putative phospholipid ABC transporter-binding protein MlaD n=1 Tax=Mycolicibacterium vanbaalenii TaxID=110539 RepID=A0A5S9PNE8_MYCVN|nr:virulence factor Mce family protein [Mycolicibacterium vanbaalenii]CAA0105475.1 putative phospholipid ABC transporter-binding protein MlaD [Mycolicibacterium vanbaalenii]